MSKRIWLIDEEAKDVYYKALKNVSNSKWKKNYCNFIRSLMKLNWNMGIKINSDNDIFIAARYLKGRYLINPRYKIEWFITPPWLSLSDKIIEDLPWNDTINRVSLLFKLDAIASDTDSIIIDMDTYLQKYLSKHPAAYIYKLTPDLIWFIHNIIRTKYLNGEIIYKHKLRKDG